MSCIFCDIIAGRAPVSLVHEDDRCLGFMTLRPTAPGECLVIPREHVDHFTDVSEELAGHAVAVYWLLGASRFNVWRP